MAYEIRRVPPGWRHPRDKDGKFIPMHDSFEEALLTWEEEKLQWRAGTHRLQEALGKKVKNCKYEDEFRKPLRGEGPYPTRGSYCAFTKAEATHYQVYEDVSEGTPLSPVFATTDEVVEWCIAQGYSRENAEAFAKLGSVPSLTRSPDGYREGIHGASTMLQSRYTRDN